VAEPGQARLTPKAQLNFIDPESRIMRTRRRRDSVFGQIKELRRFRRFALRGVAKVGASGR